MNFCKCLGILSYLFIFAAGISCFLSEGARGMEGGAVTLCSERALYMSHPRHCPLSQGHASHPILQMEAEPGPGSLAPMDSGHAWLILAQLTSQVASPGPHPPDFTPGVPWVLVPPSAVTLAWMGLCHLSIATLSLSLFAPSFRDFFFLICEQSYVNICPQYVFYHSCWFCEEKADSSMCSVCQPGNLITCQFYSGWKCDQCGAIFF